MREIIATVKKTAIGSLLPLSNSRSGFKLFLRLIFFERKTLNTAAASVDEIIPPSSIDSRIVKSKK